MLSWFRGFGLMDLGFEDQEFGFWAVSEGHVYAGTADC